MYPAGLNSTSQIDRRRARRIPAFLLGLLLVAAQAQAAFDVTIAASGSSSGGAWSGDTWTASASGARVLASEVQMHLASGAAVITTGSGGSEYGDLYVDGDITWSANALTLRAAHDVIVDGALVGSGTATLVVEYGQGTVAAGSTAVYRFNTPVKLAPYSGAPTTPHLSLKHGSDGTVFTRGVPACSGRPGGCPFLKNSTGVTEVEYHTVEHNGTADAAVWLYLDFRSDFPTTWYPFVMECTEGIGKFYYPRNQEQKNYFDASGNITNLTGLETVTTTTRFCKNFADGPTLSLLSSLDFPYGYYVKFVPTAGAYGNDYNHISVLATATSEANTTYKVYDHLVNVRPHAPTAAGAADLDLTAPAGAESTAVTLTGSGALTVSATSSNTALLPNASITGAAACAAAGTCTLTVTPAAAQYGTATVTVSVTDEWGQHATDDFTVTVLPPAPAITGLGDVAITPLGTGTTTFPISGTGVLTVTATSSDPPLLLDSGITGAAGCTAAGNCTLTLMPLDRWGAVTVTVTVADAWGQQATAHFTLTVTGTTRVIYDGNGGTAGVPTDGRTYDAGDTVTVLDGSSLSRTGHTFTGWNTAPDGSGTGYSAGDTFPFSNSVTLYAQWNAEEITFSSGGSGAFSLPWLGLMLLAWVGGRPWFRGRTSV